jgi:diguanylate cyclase (GGDEF)-like protein
MPLATDGRGVTLLVDVDDFRRLNVEHGTEAGNAALHHVIDRVRRVVRAGDHVGRWSGDGFLILMPAATPEEGGAAAERIRSVIEQTAWEWNEREVVITVTVGFAPWLSDGTAEEGIRAVEQAVEEGKQRGGNRVAAPAGVVLPDFMSLATGRPTPRVTVARSIIR